MAASPLPVSKVGEKLNVFQPTLPQQSYLVPSILQWKAKAVFIVSQESNLINSGVRFKIFFAFLYEYGFPKVGKLLPIGGTNSVFQ